MLISKPHNRPFSSPNEISMTEVCECSLSAGFYYLAQTMVIYNDIGPDSDGIFHTLFPSIK